MRWGIWEPNEESSERHVAPVKKDNETLAEGHILSSTCTCQPYLIHGEAGKIWVHEMIQ